MARMARMVRMIHLRQGDRGENPGQQGGGKAGFHDTWHGAILLRLDQCWRLPAAGRQLTKP
jgi:hypothetical protein